MFITDRHTMRAESAAVSDYPFRRWFPAIRQSLLERPNVLLIDGKEKWFDNYGDAIEAATREVARLKKVAKLKGSADTACPMCGFPSDDREEGVIDCPKCGTVGAVSCCGTQCLDCERGLND